MVLYVNVTRSLRVRVIGMLSMVILFAQVAVAAYACPAAASGADAPTQDMAGMPCAEMMSAGVALDPEQPMLCMQHCQFGSTHQVADHVSPVFVQATALPPLFTVEFNVRPDAILSSWAEDERLRSRPPPLAHSIAHCCYRI